MHIAFRRVCQIIRNTAILLSVTALAINIQSARADFSSVGDITSSVGSGLVAVDPGGGTADALMIGINDLGGILGDDQLIFGGVNPLLSDSAVIGVNVTGIGAVTLDGLISAWDISGDFTIGDEGQGLLELGTSATVDVGGTTIVGAAATGQGLVQIDGTTFPGARLRTTGDFIVGDLGVGQVQVTDRGSLLSEANVIVGNQAGGDGTVTLSDIGSRWAIQGDLTIGDGDLSGGATAARGLVEVSNDALLQVEGTTTINAQGAVALLGGTLRQVPTSAAVVNNGIIRGDGLVNAVVTNTGRINNQGALVQNGVTVINERERLVFTGEVTNTGLIESIGGEMEFEAGVVNTGGDVVGRDAILRFGGAGGLSGGGDLTLLGSSTVFGNVAVDALIVNPALPSPFTATTNFINGDVAFILPSQPFTVAAATAAGSTPAASLAPESPKLDLIVGDSPALVIDGNLDLGTSTTLEADFVSDEPVTNGDVFSLVSVTGEVTGDFESSLLIASGRYFDVDVNSSGIQATAGDEVFAGDFDLDGDVDGADFLAFQSGVSNGASLAGLIDSFGSVVSFDVPSAVAAATAVPEPSALALALLTLACCPRRRVSRS